MNKVYVLDCTLRDGGYINQWEFGETNIKKIISGLIDSKVDIIECGFLTQKKEVNQEASLFNRIEDIQRIYPVRRKDVMLVCMINYGEFDVDELPLCEHTSIDGIRVAFHKKDVEDAIELCEKINEKGYKVFVQPMVSVSYTDEEFINLIKKSNKLNPYAFYIVDSFGVMRRKELMRLFYLVDHNLSNEVCIGYHSHNNIQMAYSNAQALVEIKMKRKLIIDSSVFGMGRGAGNLNTELFIEYLNEVNGELYKIKPLLKIIDQVLNPIYSNTFWGYSLPHYISAMNNCHPNYASYLDNKNTLTVENINEILGQIDENQRNNFERDYIENLYVQYQNAVIADDKTKKILESKFYNKTIVIIAPGNSISEELDKINEVIFSENYITIAVNFCPKNIKCDYVFVSNIKRYEDLKNVKDINLIQTSNIKGNENQGFVLNYFDLLNDVEFVEDNASMMLINLLIEVGVKKIKIAGLDGYSHDIYDNYVNKDLAFVNSAIVMDSMNLGMEKMLNRFSEVIKIEFITKQKHIKLGGEK